MGRSQREFVISLLAKVDEGVIKRSIARMNDLVRSTNAAVDAEVRLDRASVDSASKLGALTGKTGANVSALRQRIAVTKLDIQAQKDALGITEKQTSAIEQQIHAQDKLNKERADSRGISEAERAGSISSFTGSISALAGGSSGVGRAFNIASDITQVVEYLPRLGEALTGVKAAGGAAEIGLLGTTASLGAVLTASAIAAPALIAIGLAVDKFAKQVNTSKEQLSTAIEAQARYFELIRTGTRESIQEELDSERARQSSLQQTIAQLEEGINSQNLFGRTAARVFGAQGELSDLKEQAEQSGIQIDTLNRALNSTEIASREATGELEKFRLEQEKLAQGTIRLIEQGARDEERIRRIAEEGTRKQLESERESVREQIRIAESQIEDLEKLNPENAEYAQRLNELRLELARLTELERELNHEVLNAVSAREKETEAIEKQVASLEKSEGIQQTRADFEAKLSTLEAKTAAERTKIADQSAASLIAIESKRLEQIGRLERDFGISEARAQEKHDLDISKLEIEARDQEIAIRKDSKDRINDLEARAALERQRILDDYNDAANDAIQNRDAVALDAAQRARNRALKDNDRDLKAGVKAEKAALKERLEEARKSNAQRITDLRNSFALERRYRLEDYNLRIADINAQAEQERNLVAQRQKEALDALAERNRQEIDAIKAGFADQLDEYGVFFTDLQTKTTAELNALALKWQQYFQKLSATVSSAGSGSNYVGANIGGTTPTPAARGIRGFRNGLLMTGERGAELMRVKNGGVDVLSNSGTRNLFAGLGQSMRSSTQSMVNNSINVGTGAFQANLSGSDPTRMMLELERRMARRFPVLLERALEEALK